MIFAVDTLEFLHKGGWIGGANDCSDLCLILKHVLEIKDGVIEAADQARTEKSLESVDLACWRKSGQ